VLDLKEINASKTYHFALETILVISKPRESKNVIPFFRFYTRISYALALHEVPASWMPIPYPAIGVPVW
jgi:hypothetical protein